MPSGYEGSGWKDVKECYFEVNARQKIAFAGAAGKGEGQAGGFQGGSVVPKCRNVDRNRRACKREPTGADARGACKRSRGLKSLNGASGLKRNLEASGPQNGASEPHAGPNIYLAISVV